MLLSSSLSLLLAVNHAVVAQQAAVQLLKPDQNRTGLSIVESSLQLIEALPVSRCIM